MKIFSNLKGRNNQIICTCILEYNLSRRVLHYAFDEVKLEAVISETQAKNEPSIKLLKRLGMTLDSTLERFGEQQVIYMVKSGQTRLVPDKH